MAKRDADRTAAKHFARKRANDEQVPTVPLSIEFLRDDEPETHHFTARPHLNFGPMVGMVKYGEQEDARSITNLYRQLRQIMVNDDGTPEKWKPKIVDEHFTAPDGTHADVEQLPKYLEFDAGSSRRRLVHLMEFDDDVVVDFDVMQDVFQYLVEQATERPT